LVSIIIWDYECFNLVFTGIFVLLSRLWINWSISMIRPLWQHNLLHFKPITKVDFLFNLYLHPKVDIYVYMYILHSI
jgi:hypothetical protein